MKPIALVALALMAASTSSYAREAPEPGLEVSMSQCIMDSWGGCDRSVATWARDGQDVFISSYRVINNESDGQVDYQLIDTVPHPNLQWPWMFSAVCESSLGLDIVGVARFEEGSEESLETRIAWQISKSGEFVEVDADKVLCLTEVP